MKLTDHEKSIESIVSNAIQAGIGSGEPIVPRQNSVIRQGPPGFYCYDGKFWSVPKSFKFPNMKLRIGWHCWLRGLPGNRTTVDGRAASVSAPIIPFRNINPKTLPSKISLQFCGEFVPIFYFNGKCA